MSSTAWQARPAISAAMTVVPEPQNGSYTACPGAELFSIGRCMQPTGFWVLCPVSLRWCGMAHTVVWLRSPDQWPVRPFLTAYQAGSCCQW